jgi:hypothetical protein
MKDGDINTRPGEEESQAPRKLVAALKEPSPRRVFVPPTVDEAILRAARQHLAPEPTARRNWLLWWAMATACLVFIAVGYFLSRPNAALHFAREDLNRDGHVDVLDAFQLERELESGGKTAAGLDLNDDGVVDRRDVARIAAQAVKLEKGGRS